MNELGQKGFHGLQLRNILFAVYFQTAITGLMTLYNENESTWGSYPI